MEPAATFTVEQDCVYITLDGAALCAAEMAAVVDTATGVSSAVVKLVIA